MQVRWLINRRPVTVAPSATLRETSELLIDNDVGALVVYGDDKILGMVSERDIVAAAASARDMDDPVSAVMVPAPLTAEPETPVATVARSMRANWIRHVPVIDGDGELVGVVSVRDMLAVFLSDPKSAASDSWLTTVE